MMNILQNAAPATETRPAVRPVPKEAIPDNPNDPFGVGPAIIEEIEEIGRKYTGPQK